MGAGFRLVERTLAEVDAGFAILEMRVTKRGVEPDIVSDNREPIVKQLNGMIYRIPPPAPCFVPGPEITFVRVQVADGVFREAPLFVIGESELEGRNDHSSETFLHRKDILEDAVVVLGP